ncbi:MAG: NAD(P)H-dependent oxidoreductase subunit E, partial [Nitrospirota bacterium]
MEKFRANLMLCAGTGCVASGTTKVRDALREEIQKRGLDEEIKIVLTGCNGYCAEGPVLSVYPDEIFYQKLTVEEIPKLVEEHFLKGRPYEKLMFKEPEKKTAIPLMKDIPFFKHQVLRVLRNKGLIDPEKIEEYIARDGYQAAAKALTRMTVEDIIKVVKDSGLRG